MSRAALRRLGLVLLWGGSLVGIGYGLNQLEPLAWAATPAGPWRLEWVKDPPTIDDWIVDEVVGERGAYNLEALRNVDIHDPRLCTDVATALGKSPWIAKVHRVSKRSDGVVTVHATFRRYVTFVMRDGLGYLVDENGVRLPRQETRSKLETYPPMILLQGVREPPPEVGKKWPGEDARGGKEGDVVAGSKLVEFLHKSCPTGLLESLQAVDVSNYDNRLNRRDGWLRICTIHPDTVILWGLPPGCEEGVESTAKRKLELLWSLYSERGQLPDRGTIDVRAENSILVRDPLRRDTLDATTECRP